MSTDEESPAQKLHKIRLRCISRDQNFLRFPRKNAMRTLADDFNEWIVGEIKDTLMTLEILKSLGHQGINTELQHYEDRVKKIQETYMRKVITPMRKIGRGTSGGANEEEYFRKFQTAIGDVIGTIQELTKIRENLTAMTVTIECLATESTSRSSNQTYVR